MEDSCIVQAAVGAAFGGAFGGMFGAATTTFLPNQAGTSLRSTVSYAGKTSMQYALIASTYAGVHCVSESVTGKSGPHNAVVGGISVGVVGALLTSNHKHGLALGGVMAICMGALDYAGGSLDTRQEKDMAKLSGLQLPK